MNTVANNSGIRRGGAFTLIELLTVIMIIGILVAIIVPSISAALRIAQSAKTQSRIQMFSSAAMGYQQDEKNRFYPGAILNEWGSLYDANNPAGLTGSQYLARAVFTDKSGAFPASNYANYSADLLDDATGTRTGVAYTLLDGFSDPKALCYYPACSGVVDLSQYNEGHNLPYTNASSGGVFTTFITNYAMGSNKPYMDRQFLLIGPGIDRLYFNGDDLTNFRK